LAEACYTGQLVGIKNLLAGFELCQESVYVFQIEPAISPLADSVSVYYAIFSPLPQSIGVHMQNGGNFPDSKHLIYLIPN
jgi:hypothetical protein